MTAVRFAITVDRAEHEPEGVTIACERCGATLIETLVYVYGCVGPILVDHARVCDGGRAAEVAT